MFVPFSYIRAELHTCNMTISATAVAGLPRGLYQDFRSDKAVLELSDYCLQSSFIGK